MVARKYTEEILRPAVENSVSWAGVLRYLNLQDAGGNRSHLKRNVVSFGISTQHFLGQAHGRGKINNRKKHHSEYLILLPAGSKKMASERLRKAMIEYGFVYQCCFDECPTRGGWINGPIMFEIDHINGNNIDNRPENLRFICAICHSQQPTSSHSWKNTERSTDDPFRCSCGGRKTKTKYKSCKECRWG